MLIEVFQGQYAFLTVPGEPASLIIGSIMQNDTSYTFDLIATGIIRRCAHNDTASAGGVQRLDLVLRGAGWKVERAINRHHRRISAQFKAGFDSQDARRDDNPAALQASCSNVAKD